MVNKETMDKLELLGFGSDIDAFESYVQGLMDSYAMGKPEVKDDEYDGYRKILKEVKPESKLFLMNAETEDNPLDMYDEILREYGMASIHTIDGIDEDSLSDLINVVSKYESVNLEASVKQNGHAARAIYVNGKLYGGSTRGRRNGKGRDISRHLKTILPNEIEGFKGMPLVEIRGELIVTEDMFNRVLKPTGLKTPLSSVTSLVRESATEEEIKLLHFVAYKVIPIDETLRPKTLSQEFDILEACGFEVSPHVSMKGITSDEVVGAVEALLQYFEQLRDDGELEFDSDGFVVAVDNNDIFYNAGRRDNYWLGNVAVKEGKFWGSKVYSSTILYVEMNQGKSYLTPKAVIEPVVCRNGATVKNVPLYNIGVMERYQLYTGQEIYFQFGGETGVTLCDEYGNSVRDI